MSETSDGRGLRVADKIPPQINKYYLRVSRIYKGIAFLLLLTFFASLLFVIIFCGDSVTYENVRYLARDLGAMLESDSYQSGITDITYSGGTSMKFEAFKNGLAQVSAESFRYYDSSGIKMIEEDSGCNDPVMVPSDKYLMIYDLGGTGYAVYNQLTRVISRSADNKIIAADMSSSGAYILVTRSRETKYVVEVYNAAFSKTMSIYKENYVLGAAVSPDGSLVMICSAIPSDTDFMCEVSLCKTGVSESVATHLYSHTMPLDVYATEDGFIMLSDNGIYFYNNDGSENGSISLSGVSLRYADISEKCIAVVGSTDNTGTVNKLIVSDFSGEILLDRVINGRVTGIEASENLDDALTYLETPDGIVRYTIDGSEKKYEISGIDVLDVIPVFNGAIVCTKNRAYTIFAD